MNNFDIIECGYNRNDETINFGTRCLAAGDNLYETCTLATLKSSEECSGTITPYIKATVKSSRIFFSVNNLLRVFGDAECTTLALSASFDDIVDTFSIADNGKYIFVGLRNGAVRLLGIADDKVECIYNTRLLENVWSETFFVASFLENFTSELTAFIVVSKRGKVFRIKLQHPVGSEENTVTSEQILDVGSSIKLAAFSYPLLVLNGTEITLHDLKTGETDIDSGYNLVKLYPLGSMVCGLTDEGTFIKICNLTLIPFPIATEKLYSDVMVVSENSGKPKHLMACTQPNDQGVRYIECLTYPDLDCVYSISVEYEIRFIVPETVNDEAMYISKRITGESASELRFHMIYETEPEKRLSRLLKKGRFEEAESFAKMFNLDVAIINHAKARVIEDKMVCSTKDVDNLLELLATIDENEVKLRCCINVHCCCAEYEDVKRILTYGCNIVPTKKTSNLSTVAELQSTISQLMFRFDLFSAIYGKENYTMTLWTRFAGVCLFEELNSQLRERKINDAIITYSHLDDFAIRKLTQPKIEGILSILNELPVNVYQPFLPTFLPVTLSYLPQALPVFVEWLYNKMFRLEKRERGNFPDNGLQFSETIIKLLKVDSSSNLAFQRECHLHKDSLNMLSNLLHSLKGIQALKNTFKINIPLEKYLLGPKAIIRFLLNINLISEECDIMLRDFLCPLMYEHQLDPDATLLEEIQNMMGYKETYWVNTIEPVIKYISAVRVKLEAIQIILEFSQAPWSEIVRRIALDALNYSHPMVSQIKEMIEDEPMLIVLGKPKYKIRDKRIGDVDDLKFTISRILFCDDEDMVEDVYKLCKTNQYRHEANLLLFRHFVRSGDFTKAFSILDNNTPDEILKCVEELGMYASVCIDDEPKLRDNYYDIIGSIYKRWIDLEDDTFRKSCLSDRLDWSRAAYTLRKTFNKSVSSFTLSNPSYRKGLLDDLVNDLDADFRQNHYDIVQVLTICEKISSCLKVCRDEILIKFCELVGDFSMILDAAEHLYANNSNTRNLCLIAVSIMKYMGCITLKNQHHTSDDGSFELQSFNLQSIEDDSELFVKGIKLAQTVLSKALVSAKSDTISPCLEVCGWISTGFYLTRCQPSKVQIALSKNLFMSTSTKPGFVIFSALHNVFNLYCSFIGNFDIPAVKYLTYFADNQITEEDFLKELQTLPSVLDNLCREGQQLTAFKIVINLQRGLLLLPEHNEKATKILNNIMRTCCLPPMLRAVVSASHIDSSLLYDLLLSCDQNDAVKFILQNLRLYKRQPNKFAALACAGVQLLTFYNMADIKQVWMSSLLSVKWWQKLDLDGSKKMMYDNFSMMKPSERMEHLITLNCIGTQDIKEYCADFSLDSQTYYIMLLKETLVRWKPVFEIEVDVYGKRSLLVKSDEELLMKTCLEIIDCIGNNEVIYETVSSLWSQVNFYHYEVFICIVNILAFTKQKKFDTKNLPMLMCLKSYQRVSKSSQEEIEHWFTTFPTTQSVDVFSEFRLPFIRVLFTTDVWKIIRPELTLQTYSFWFQTISILKYLNKDDICSYVVKGIVSSGILQAPDSNEWIVHTKHEDLFSEIDECIQHMTSLEQATSVAYHLMTHTPRGADQVNAAAMCYKYALKYKESVPPTPDVEKAFVKVQNRFFSFSAMHILHVYQLAEERYLQLVADPKDLVTTLYQDERILKKADSIDFQCPDINRAVDSLAELFDTVDIEKLRRELVNNWLADSTLHALDVSIMKNMDNMRNGQLSEDNLKRATYLCSGGNISKWQSYLFKSGFDEKDEEKTLYFRARALKCYCAISDVDTITQKADLTYEEFQNYIDKLSLVSDLEYVGFTMDTDMLDQYKKRNLLNRLGQSGSNPLHVKIMAKLCITYSIFDVKYWEFIINCAIGLNMIYELKTYVNILKDRTFKYKAFYINAWQKIIDHSFQISGTDDMGDIDELLLNNFLLIQACPVIFTLKYDGVLRRCLQFGKNAFAAILLQYFPEEKRQSYIQEILVVDKDELQKQLDYLQTRGLWDISKVKGILNSFR